MNILLLGKNGQVGWELQRALAPLGKITALGRDGTPTLCGDLANPDQLRETVRRLQPDVIVNAAAYTAVDKAESEPKQAEQINAEAPRILAEEATRINAWLVHYSTDYIFDGSGAHPWQEDDTPAPLNIYGQMKWEGEKAVRQANAKHLIFRTQWVYATLGKNFIRTMLQLAAERANLQVIDDQTGVPTSAELIADTTAHALRTVADDSGKAGTYHLAASGETTWHGYARFVIRSARKQGWPVQVDDETIQPVPTTAFSTPAQRPHNSRLETSKLEQAFGLIMPDWRDGVTRAMAEMQHQSQDK